MFSGVQCPQNTGVWQTDRQTDWHFATAYSLRARRAVKSGTQLPAVAYSLCSSATLQPWLLANVLILCGHRRTAWFQISGWGLFKVRGAVGAEGVHWGRSLGNWFCEVPWGSQDLSPNPRTKSSPVMPYSMCNSGTGARLHAIVYLGPFVRVAELPSRQVLRSANTSCLIHPTASPLATEPCKSLQTPGLE